MPLGEGVQGEGARPVKADADGISSAKRLTLITTAFRSAQYMDAYCAGVAALTNLEEIEVRLVMNGPDEAERRIVAEYSLAYPGVFQVWEVARESIGASVNRGLLEARTPYVAFLDVDDVRVPDSLARQIAVLDSNPDVDFTYGDLAIVPAQGITEGRRVTTPEFDRDEFTRSCVASPTQMIRRSLLERVGGIDEQLRCGGDYEFQIRAALGCRFAKTPGLMVYYTKDREGRSASSSYLQPLERTVVELRYGLYDKTMSLHGFPFIAEARSSYRLNEILLRGEWHSIEEFVPGHGALLAGRAESLRRLERHYSRWRRRQVLGNWLRPIVSERLERYSRAAMRRVRLTRR